MIAPDVCPKCRGDRQVADTQDQEPWSMWTGLPLHSAVAVLAGVVKPMDCPACGGTGLSAEALRAANTTVRLTGEYLCPACTDEGFVHYSNPEHPSGRVIQWYAGCSSCEKLQSKEHVRAAHAALCGCDVKHFDDLVDKDWDTYPPSMRVTKS